MGLTKEENQDFWNRRADFQGIEEFATSNDPYLRALEIQKTAEYIHRIAPKTVYDLGCGNGYSTFQYALRFKDTTFLGLDYAEKMIRAAQARLESEPTGNLHFATGDITSLQLTDACTDMVTTSRVLINLQNFDNQVKAVKECARILKPGGTLLLLESVSQSYDNLNKYRHKYGLPLLKPHPANCYIDEDRFLPAINDYFKLQAIDRYSSSYYLGSRIAYTLILGQEGRPDPHHRVHEFFAEVSPVEDCGREKIFLLIKR